MGENLPAHDHITNLLKTKAKQEERNIIKKHATLPGTSNKAMVNEIAQNILSSSHPNALYSMSTTTALRLALYREKKKLNPLPPLPCCEFLILSSWTNNMELEAMMVFMSKAGADVMRRAPVKMMDGTIHPASKLYFQVTMI